LGYQGFLNEKILLGVKAGLGVNMMRNKGDEVTKKVLLGVKNTFGTNEASILFSSVCIELGILLF
jgi:hypothetical protein